MFPGNGTTWKGVGQDDPPAAGAPASVHRTRLSRFASALGRDCASVEVLWVKFQPVQDPCTLLAIQGAAQWAVGAATAEQTKAAIRGGSVDDIS